MAGYPHVYLAGRWVGQDETAVPIGSMAMRYALSVFEGVRLYVPDGGGRVRPFLLGEHVARLARSLALTRLPDPGVAGLPALVEELVDRNEIVEDAYVRVAVTPTNPGELHADPIPVVSITATAMGRKRWLAEGAGMSLTVSTRRRAPAEAFPPDAKNISNYAGPRLALLEARDAGFDGCVLTNQAGRLSEAPTAALFLVRDGELLTPALTEDVLPSITRGWVLRTAAACGVAARETTLTPSDAHGADEAFLCGTGLEIAPVRGFDGKPVGHWPSTPVTRDLVERYFTDARAPGARVPAPAAGGEVTAR